MRKALLTGGSSKFGAVFKRVLEESRSAGYDLQGKSRWDVEVVPREFISSYPKEWQPKLSGEEYDLIFFNHNTPVRGMNGFDDTDVDIIKKLNPRQDVKIGWMITGDAIHLNKSIMVAAGYKSPHFQLYIAQKAIYITRMRYYYLQSGFRTFVVNPGHMEEPNYARKARQLSNFIDKDFAPCSVHTL